MVKKQGSEKERFIQRKGPKQDRSRVTVDSIRQATMDLLAKDGFVSLSTAKISKRAGVSAGTFYDYFPNKEALLMNLFESTSSKLVVAMRDFMASVLEMHAEQVITKGVKQLLLLHEEHKLVVIDMVRELPELRLAEHPLSFGHLGRGSLLIFLQHRARHLKFEDLECKAFFIHQVLTSSIREYLANPVPYISRQKFIENLTQILTAYAKTIIDPKQPTLDMATSS